MNNHGKSNKILLIFVNMFVFISALKCFSVTPVYGDWDDRMQYYELAKSTNQKIKDNLAYYQELATSVCLITAKSNIASSSISGKTKLYLYKPLYLTVIEKNNKSGYKVACDGMKFANEYVVDGGGSGALIDNNKILTADHVYNSWTGAQVCIFNYYKTSENSFPVLWEDAAKTKPYVLVNTSDVYTITQAPYQFYPKHRENYSGQEYHNLFKYDWAVLTLDRDVSVRQRRLCYYQKNDVLAQLGVYKNELFTWGFPWNLPMIYTDDAHLLSSDYYLTDLDCYQGNSGCPVFVQPNSTNQSIFNYKVIGIPSQEHAQDYKVQPGSVNEIICPCWSDNWVKPTLADNSINLSFIDDIAATCGVSYNNCSIPWSKNPNEEPKPNTRTQVVPGENIKIRFTPRQTGIYISRFKYAENNKYIQEPISKKFLSNDINKIQEFELGFIPAGLGYTWEIFYLSGAQTFLSGSGHAGSKTTGTVTLDIPTKINAYALVGDAPDYPYTTLQQAIDNSPAGTTLHVASGVYDENIIITKPLKIIGEPNAVVMITSSTSNPALSITSNDVTINNLYFKNKIFNGTAIALEGVTGCCLMNNQFQGYTTAIVLKNGCAANSIDGNLINSATTTYGLEINASTENTITNNVINYGWGVINYIGCTAESNTISGNILANTRERNANMNFIYNLLLE